MALLVNCRSFAGPTRPLERETVVLANRRLVILALCPFLILEWAILLGFPERIRAQSSIDEYRLKAAFLFHFSDLVTWPPGAMSDDNQPLKLCTLGDDPFRGELERTVEGKKIATRTLQVLHFKQPQDLPGCEILFIGPSEEKRLSAILAQLGNTPTLTVGEADDFTQRGGMIRIFLADNKIRFDINLGASDRVRLKISSRLLLLANTVVGNHGGG